MLTSGLWFTYLLCTDWDIYHGKYYMPSRLCYRPVGCEILHAQQIVLPTCRLWNITCQADCVTDVGCVTNLGKCFFKLYITYHMPN